MVEWITTIITAIQSNSIVAGIFGTTILAGLAAYLRNVPEKIYDYLFNFFTTRLVFDQISKSSSDISRTNVLYEYLISEISKYKKFTFRRKYDVTINYGKIDEQKNQNFLTIKDDRHAKFIPSLNIFYYTIIQKVLIRYQLSEIDNKHQRTFVLTIRFFTRNQKKVQEIILKLLKDYENGRCLDDYSEVIYNRISSWVYITKEKQFSQSPFMLTKQQEDMYQKVARFLNAEEKYNKLCKPYHTGFILYGKPGCGKSQFVKKIAEDFNLSIYVLNLSLCSTDSLISLMSSINSFSIILIEDIDRLNFHGEHKQKLVQKKFNPFQEGPEETEDIEEDTVINRKSELVSFSTVLNVIDGIYGVNNGAIFIATTNHFESLDPAFKRPGRFDYCIEFDYLNKQEICKFLHIQYNNNNPIELCDDVQLPISIVSNLCFECDTIEKCAERINKEFK